MSGRTASVKRETNETRIACELSLDGAGRVSVATGLGFLDHMLTALATHARFDLELTCEGDLQVDDHHTVEDCALVLGAVIDEALGDRAGIARFGSAYAPLDESLARVVVDLSGRPSAEVELGLRREMLGTVACENIGHFFVSLAVASREHAARRCAARRERSPQGRGGVQGVGARAACGGFVGPAFGRRAVDEGTADMSVAVVRTGVANTASVLAGFGRLGAEASLTDDAAVVRDASHVVLPGVGSFASGMEAIRRGGLDVALVERVRAGRPTLAVCVGLATAVRVVVGVAGSQRSGG